LPMMYDPIQALKIYGFTIWFDGKQF
jgi:uncharacterized protein YqgQ